MSLGSAVRTPLDVDYRMVFERAATPCLLVLADAPRFTVVAATNAYLALVSASSASPIGAALQAALSNAGLLADDQQLELLRASVERAVSLRSATRARLGHGSPPATRESGGAQRAAWVVLITPVLSARDEISQLLLRFDRAEASPPDGDALGLEQLLDQRTSELAAVSAELDAFSYSVAHDLRAPLRAIDGFSQALVQDYAGVLGKDAGDYLQHISAGAQRMSTLLDGMLELSLIQRSPLRKTTLDVSGLAQRIVARLQHTEPDRKVAFDIEPRLRVYADSHLMNVLLEKLLGNAWKFTRKKAHASIRLGLELRPEAATLFVADDGVGFDMASAGRLFSPFQRLHKPSEYEGTGMGLSIAHRIVARHAGRIWADAAPGEGAIFRWTVELAPESPPQD